MDGIKINGSNGSKKGKAKHKKSTKTAVIIAGAVLVGTALLALMLSYGKGQLRTAPPEGIVADTNQPISGVGFVSHVMDISATITFPDGGRFTITGEDAGIYSGVQTGLRNDGNTGYNEQYVRDVVAANTKRFNDSLVDEVFEMVSDSIVIIKGSGIEPADEAEVYALTVDTLQSAIENETHLTVDYVPSESGMKDMDILTLHERIFVEPVSATYDPEIYGASESVMGVSFNMQKAQELFENAAVGKAVEIPLIFTEPELTSEELEEMLFRDVLSERTTGIAGTNNRLTNVQLSSAAIDGTVLNPGEVFSFNGIVGQRTAEKGYREAGAYVNNETVQEIGGGICQTSSTIYDCVLYADLEVVERLNHMFIVTYLPLGNDATINWGTADLKFKNNTEYPIRIEAVVEGRNLSVTLYGTKLDGNYITIDSVQISMTPYAVVEREDEGVPQGSSVVKTDGYTGYVIDTYKNIFDEDDNLISRSLVHRSTYQVRDKLILISIPQEPEDPEEGEDPEDSEYGEHGEEAQPETDIESLPEEGTLPPDEEPGNEPSGNGNGNSSTIPESQPHAGPDDENPPPEPPHED